MNLGIYENYPTKLHLEPTTNCNARCPQCPRIFYSSLLTEPNLKITEWVPEDLRSVLKDNFFQNLKEVLINGNFGDIVMHTKPRELVEVFLDLNMSSINIHTNGGGLSTEFWRWLGSQNNVTVEFGIDGLEDTHHLYRRNTRFEVVMKNAKAFIEAGGSACWVMTVFKHNEHQVDECKYLANQKGFKYFKQRPSVRWASRDVVVLDANMNELYRLEPASSVEERFKHLERTKYEKMTQPAAYDVDISYLKPMKEIDFVFEIDCSVIKDNSVYLSADGKLYPCCWTSLNHQKNLMQNKSNSFVETFVKKYGYDPDFNSVLKNKISDIIDSGLFREIEETWYSNKQFDACRRQCSVNSNWYYQLNKSDVKSI